MAALVTFEVAGRRLALAVESFHAAVRAVAITPLPKAPLIVEGVINYRGTLLPVLGIRQRFGLDPAPLTPEHQFLIVQAGPRTVALHVDRVLDLVTVENTDIDPTSRVVPGLQHVAGFVRLSDGLLVIQDLERFLSLDEGAQIDGALAGRAR